MRYGFAMKRITVKGIIFSGGGEGRRFLSLEWVRKQISEKLGFEPYPGTLNIRLTAGVRVKDLIGDIEGVEIEPTKGFCRGLCFRALIMDEVRGAVVIPEVSNYPGNVVEVIAPMDLRRALKLKDGEILELTILAERKGK